MASRFATLNLADTIGALEIGSLFAVFLFGIVTLQAHLYYQHFGDDRWQFKYLVAFIWVLELAHTICVSGEIYRATITHYGQPQNLFPFPLMGAGTTLGGCITFLVHSFFSLRCWKVLPKPYNVIGLFCAVVSFLRFIGSIVLGVNAAKAMDLVVYRQTWGWLIMTLLAVGAGIDIVIAFSMMFYLIQQREKVFARSMHLIDRLVQYTVCTGLLTSLGAIAMVICYQALPSAMIWLGIYSCLAKLYSNSLLAVLNGRASLRTGLSHSSSAVEPNSRVTRSRRGTNDKVVIAVEMKSTVHTVRDEPAYMGKSQYGLDNHSHSDGFHPSDKV